MARVEQSDLVVNERGIPQQKVLVKITPVAGSSGTTKLWAAETGIAELPSIETNHLGIYSVWLDEGRYDVQPAGSNTKRVELISESTVSAATIKKLEELLSEEKTPPARPIITGTTYYVSATGNDAESGTTEGKAWKTITKVNEAVGLKPGDGVLFKGGDTFAGELHGSASGTQFSPIVYGSYGTGNANVEIVWLYPKREWIVVDHLTCVGSAESSAVGGYGSHNTIQNCNLSQKEHCGVNVPSGEHGSYTVVAKDWKVWFNYIHDTGDSGILAEAAVEEATAEEEAKSEFKAEYPGEEFVIENNIIEKVGTNEELKYGKHGIYLKAKNSIVKGNQISFYPGAAVSQRYSNCIVEENECSQGAIGLAFFQYGNTATVGTSNWKKNIIKEVEAGLYCPEVATVWEAHKVTVVKTKESFNLSGNVIGPITSTNEREYDNLKTFGVINDDGTNIHRRGSVATSAVKTTATNTSLGNESLRVVSTGVGNTAVGVKALTADTEGIGNTALGEGALQTNKVGKNNVAIGVQALNKVTSSNNVAIGVRSCDNLAAASNNTAVGYQSLEVATAGEGTVAIGANALKATTTGEENTAVGFKALAGNTKGSANVAIGVGAMEVSTEISSTVAVGASALKVLSTGKNNTAIGANSLKATTTGSKNTALGAEAGFENKVGEGNTFIGYRAGLAELGSNKLYIAANETAEPLILGVFPNAELTFNTTKISLYKGVAPVSRAVAIGSPAAELAPLKVAVDAIREAIKKIGITE